MQRSSPDPRATTSSNPDDGFRSFVAAVSEPLTRLAYVLTVGAPGQPAAGVLAANALAQVRRQWREVAGAGLPEQLAVDALLSEVLKRRRRSPSPGPVDDEAVDAAAATESSADVGQRLVREASWRAFGRLSRRQRALLVFADPSVAAVRFAGLDVPPSLGSPRRQSADRAAAIESLRAALRSDAAVNAHAATRTSLDALADEQLVLLASDAIRAHASSAPPVFDPNTEVGVRVAHLRRRALLASGVVVVLIAAAGVSAVVASTPKTVPRAAASAASSAVAESPTATPFPQLPAVVPVAAQPSTDPDQPVVAWRVRGDRLDSPVLLARIEAAFSQAHPDATSRPQVLLIADTPAFRLAYVTATMPGGVAQSWFSGPTGSDDMAESAFSVGHALVATSVIAARLHQASGSTTTRAGSASTTELVIIAAPTAPSIQVFGLVEGSPGAESIALDDGIAVRAVGLNTAVVSPTQINISTETYAVAGISDIELDANKSYATGDASTQHLSAVPDVMIERGLPDPALLADALLVAQAWQHPGLALSPAPVVLWGGTDSVGTKLVVARVHAVPFDLLVLEWSGDAPRLHGEVLVRSTSPEVPVAFAYRSAQGTRIGIISEPADKAAALSFEGSESPVAMFDDGGFASIPLTGAGGLPSDVNVNASPPPSNEFSGLIDATVEVELFGFDDQVRTLLNVPPAL